MFYNDGYFSAKYASPFYVHYIKYRYNWDRSYSFGRTYHYMYDYVDTYQWVVINRILRDYTIATALKDSPEAIEYCKKSPLTPPITFDYIDRLILNKYISKADFVFCMNTIYIVFAGQYIKHKPSKRLKFHLHNAIINKSEIDTDIDPLSHAPPGTKSCLA